MPTAVQIGDLTALTTVAIDDVLPIEDTSSGNTRKIAAANLLMIPDSVTFSSSTGSALNTVITSATATLNGNTLAVWPLTVRGDGSPEMRINSGAWGAYGNAIDGDTVQVRLTSSGTVLTARVATLYSPGRTATFSVTTQDLFVPTDFDAGCSYWIADPSSCYTDTGLTTPAGNGDLIAAFEDLSGNGKHLTQSNSSYRFTLVQSGSNWYAQMPSGQSGYTSSLSLSSGAQCIVLSAADATSSGSRIVNSTGGVNSLIAPRRSGLSFYVAGNTICTATQANSSRHTTLVAKAGGGAAWRVRFDGSAQSVSGNGSDWTAVVLGREGDFGEYSSNSIFYRMAAMSSNPTGTDQTDLETWAGQG